MIRKEDCVRVGYVSKSHNLRGEVVVTSENDLLEKYINEPVFILLDGAPVPFFIEDEELSVRNHNSYIVKFEFIDSLKETEKIIGKEIFIERELIEEEDIVREECNILGLVGFAVKDTLSKEEGVVTDISDYAGNVVMTLDLSGKEILIPVVEEYILSIDHKERYVEVRIPDDIKNL